MSEPVTAAGRDMWRLGCCDLDGCMERDDWKQRTLAVRAEARAAALDEARAAVVWAHGMDDVCIGAYTAAIDALREGKR